MILRRSGRTTALLRTALNLTSRHRQVVFVVWNSHQIDSMYAMLHDDHLRGLGYPNQLAVISYEEYVRNIHRYPNVIFDHYVTEELARLAGKPVGPDCIEVYLRVGDWYQRRTITTDLFHRGTYRLAMIEPLATCAYGPALDMDGTAAVELKTVDFHRTNEHKDGLLVFSNNP